MRIDKAKVAALLSEAWVRYTKAFGTAPKGTEKQMAALLELAKPEEWIVVDSCTGCGEVHEKSQRCITF